VNYVFRTTQLFLFALALLPNFAHGASLLSSSRSTWIPLRPTALTS